MAGAPRAAQRFSVQHSRTDCREKARGVTAMVVGSGALFGDLGNVALRSPASLPLKCCRAPESESVFFPVRTPRARNSPPTLIREAGPSLRTTEATNDNAEPANARTFIAELSEKFTLEGSMAKVCCRTSKMSHDRGWRAACGLTIWSLGFHIGDS